MSWTSVVKRKSVAGVGDEVEFAATEFTGHFHAEVLDGDAQLFLAVRTIGIERDRLGGRSGKIKTERTRAELARDSLTDVLAVDPQFFVAVRAEDVVARRRNFDHAVNLLQWEELWDFDAIRFQILIEQRATVATPHLIRRHPFAARGTFSTGPIRHVEFRCKDLCPTRLADQLFLACRHFNRENVRRYKRPLAIAGVE